MDEQHQPPTPEHWRILVLAPLSADGRVLCRTLNDAGFRPHNCRDVSDLYAQQDSGAAALIICEEALEGAGAEDTARALAQQPEWSDLPILVIGLRGPAAGHGWRQLQQARGASHVLLLKRPLTIALLVTTIRAALECRARQYRVRDELQRRREAEEHLRLISAEMDHRLRNTLAMVDSLVRQSADHTLSVQQFCDVFRGRLRSFAQAHNILMQSHWQGMTVEEVVSSELTPRLASAEQFSIRGPRLTLPPRAALALYMAVHELATNAVKYGAASTQDGHIDVSWRVLGGRGEPQLELLWLERGGPSVQPPRRTGFGTRLVDRLIERELGGSVHADFAPDGLTCRIQVPLPAMKAGAALAADPLLLAAASI